MKYMLLICTDKTAPRVEAMPEGVMEIEDWVTDLDTRGVRLLGERLHPAREATTVSIRNGALTISDGPYADTKELIAGFDVVECNNLDEAIAIAAKHPMAVGGRIEIRTFWSD